MSLETTLRDIHQFSGHPGKFWPAYLEFASRQAGAGASILLVRKEGSSTWKQRCAWTEEQNTLSLSGQFLAAAEKIAAAALQKGNAWAHLRSGAANLTLIGLRLRDEDPGQASVIVFLAGNTSEAELTQMTGRLQLLADAPAVYQRERANRRALKDMGAIADTLDLMILLNDEKHYLAAAMTLVNETAARYRCARASLGWLEKGYVHLQAISHMERFEKKMDIVSSLEAAMEEALDQDEEIVLPPAEENGAVVRDHQRFAGEQQVTCMLSLPIRLEGQVVGVLTCERGELPFAEDEVRGLRILCDQVARRLADLKANDRWFGAKLGDGLRKAASGLLGVEHTLAKVTGLLTGLLLLAAVVVQLPYRVEAPFILKSDDVRQVSVPFEGYIDEVHVKIGQQVKLGELLLSLDSEDLLLEESAAIANQIRYLREMEKARARGSLVEMQIAQAQADQAKAQLELVRYRLKQARLRSPIDGIVVEGDLEELRGAPVAQGDILFKVARNEKLFAELKVNERDIHELAVGQDGEIAFVSQPRLKFPVNVERLDPVAQAGDEGNVFFLRGNSSEQSPPWWRPGMSGIAKVEVGQRRIIWILTHRTIDFLRMLLWW